MVSPGAGADFNGSVTGIVVGSCLFCSVISAASAAAPVDSPDSPCADDPPSPLLEQPEAAITTIASDASEPFTVRMTMPSKEPPPGTPPRLTGRHAVERPICWRRVRQQ